MNRLDNILGDGTKVVEEIVNQFTLYQTNCKVLAASFKNAQQVQDCAAVGCHSVTVSEEILKSLITHPLTDVAVKGFDRDWNACYKEKTILDM